MLEHFCFRTTVYVSITAVTTTPALLGSRHARVHDQRRVVDLRSASRGL